MKDPRWLQFRYPAGIPEAVPSSLGGGGLALEADRVNGDNAIDMAFAGLRCLVFVAHGDEGLSGRVTVLQVLKNRPAKPILAFVRNTSQELAITFDDEVRQATM